MHTNPNPLPSWTVPVETASQNVLAQAIKEAARLIAEAIHRQADATYALAQATAGEFDQEDAPQGEQYLDGSPR